MTEQYVTIALIVGLAVGAVMGAVLVNVLVVIPAHQHIAYYRGISIRYRSLAERAMRAHQGTPYRPETVAAAKLIKEAFTPDDHIGSRKAPDAPVVSLPRPRVQTGRPA